MSFSYRYENALDLNALGDRQALFFCTNAINSREDVYFVKIKRPC